MVKPSYSFLSLGLGLIFCSVGSSLQSSSVSAQVTPDGTTSTTVDVNGNSIEINNGDQRGTNLYHSFQDFSVPNGGEASFNNAPEISNIFSRVTGGNISNIDGLIQAEGNANLFLINPAGIMFGGGARLDIGGSFYGSTADSILFEEGEFSATDITNTPVLTINAPIGLNFRDNPAQITVNGNGETSLAVRTGQDIALIGGELNLNSGQISARGGSVTLGSIAIADIVEFDDTSGFSFSSSATRGNISLNNFDIFVSSDTSGSINLDAANINLSESSFFGGIATDSGFVEAQAGDINLVATGEVNLSQNSLIQNVLNRDALGSSGNINVQASSLSINNSRVFSGILSTAAGSAGDINLDLANSVLLENSSRVSSSTFGAGDAGNINIQAGDTITVDGRERTENGLTGILSDVAENTDMTLTGNGNGGTISISTPNLSVIEGEIRSTTFGTGNAGQIDILADSVSLDFGGLISSSVGSFSRNSEQIPELRGDSGQINLETQSLSLTNGGAIFTQTFAEGNAGSITINASESVNISGVFPALIRDNGFPGFASSSIANTTQPGASEVAGDITVTTPQLEISDGGVINARTRGDFSGGNITVNVDSLVITDGGQILTSAFSNGNAGSINLNVSGNISISGTDPDYVTRLNSLTAEFGAERARFTIDPVSPNSGIFANTVTESTGDGGNITIGVFQPQDNTLMLDETQFSGAIAIADQGQIAVNSQGSGNGGTIMLRAEQLTLDNQAQILAETNASPFNQSTAEINLQLNDSIILKEDSLISAQARNNANGGNINIDTTNGFVIAFPSQNQGSDIIANAQQGVGGNIVIQTQGIIGLTENFALSNNGEVAFNQTNDIDASSARGEEFDGVIEIITPDTNLVNSTLNLEAQTIDTETNVVGFCSGTASANESRLRIIGKTGIPPEPIAPLSTELITIDGVIKNAYGNSEQTQESRQDHAIMTSIGEIVPARGVVKKETGEISLVAYSTSVDSNSNQDDWNNCRH